MTASRTALVLAITLAILTGCAKRPAVTLVGTTMTTAIAAIDFTLTDQKGAAYRLSTAKGKVVVLSFIYTHCNDICPFVTMKLKNARELLGPLAGKVDFVAITTDPERDTQAVNAAYSKEAGLYDSWHFVTGPTAEVKKVWSDFGVGVHKVEEKDAAPTADKGMSMAEPDDDAAKGLAQADVALGKTIGDKFGGGYEVTHTAPFWIIDPKGNVRVVLNADATPTDLATDIKALLSGAPK